MEKIIFQHRPEWIEKRDGGIFLRWERLSTKGFSRGKVYSGERRLSDEEYESILLQEAEYLKRQKEEEGKEKKKEGDKAARIAAYREVSPVRLYDGDFVVTATGAVEDPYGNFICFVPHEVPRDKMARKKLLISTVRSTIENME